MDRRHGLKLWDRNGRIDGSLARSTRWKSGNSRASGPIGLGRYNEKGPPDAFQWPLPMGAAPQLAPESGRQAALVSTCSNRSVACISSIFSTAANSRDRRSNAA